MALLNSVDTAHGAGKKRKRKELDDDNDTQAKYLLLEEQIAESQKNYNNIVTLLDHARARKVQCEGSKRSLALVVLCRVFCRLMVLGKLINPTRTLENESAISQWLNDRLNDYTDVLLRCLSDLDVGNQITALNLLMKLFKEEAKHLQLSEDFTWRHHTFSKTVERLLDVETSNVTRNEFLEKYVEPFHDVRYYTLGRLGAYLKGHDREPELENVLSMLAAVGNVPEQQDGRGSFYIQPSLGTERSIRSPTAHKRQAQEAWMAFLRCDLSNHQRKTVLGLMSHRIAPCFLKIELLMDFLTDSFDEGGAISLMALSGLFYLIQERNLDYPQFYQKLYSLLDSNLLHSKYRSQFFRLLDTSLSSTHLPAALVASFIKRLSRLSLFAPPSAIVVIVPWIYNLLKNHPTCTFMIHRVAERPDGEDPFLTGEADPLETDAIESSLWEIHAMQDHYHPNVATIARIISEQFTKQAYNLEDFLDHSYNSMLNADLAKEMKKAPEIEYQIPKNIFTQEDDASRQGNKPLIERCDFC